MKQVIRITALFALAMIIMQAPMAQQRLQLNINYNIATPIGATFRDYINKTSFRGAQGSVLYGINNHFSVGVQASYNDFYQKYGRQVYKATDGSDISVVPSNTLQSVPVLVKGEYSFLNKGLVKPYIGLGAGIHFVDYDQYLGEFEYDKHFTKAAFTGDAGLMVPFRRSSNYGFRLGTSYQLMPFKEESIKNLDSWDVQAGVSIPLSK